jgi:formate hydrogenlyase subunit 4
MMASLLPLLHPIVALLAAPLLPGVINRVKAFYAGRRGPPLLQLYYDLARLARKGAVYSETTTWLFRAGPVLGCAGVVMALLIVPCGGLPAPVRFAGDLLLFAWLFGLGRFFTVLAALDTGSSFEGLGASREVFFSALTEPILLSGLAVLVRLTGTASLTGLYARVTPSLWAGSAAVIVLVAVTFLVVLMTENARLPVDDPDTHLELTMIHEVMVLDHSGPDLALIHYGAAMKLWVLGTLLVGLCVPVRTGRPLVDAAAMVAGMVVLAALVGLIESTMARLRLPRVPQLLVGAGAISTLAVILSLR